MTALHGGAARVIATGVGADVHWRQRVVASRACDYGSDPWSPDGSRLAVAVASPHTGCGGGHVSTTAIARPWSGAMRRISGTPAMPVTWTQDGRELLVLPQGGGAELLDPQTGERHPTLAA